MIKLTEIKNKTLHAVYNGNETITSYGFTMTSPYINHLLSRMRKEGLLTVLACEVVRDIFSHKFTEKNPYPTQETLARNFDVDAKSIRNAVASIKKAGIILITKVINPKTGKESRNNQYDFTPFFELLEKFIIEVKEKGNFKVKIAELMNIVVEKKESKTDFSELPKVESKVTKVEEENAPSKSVQEDVQDVLEEEEVKLPSILLNTCKVLKLDDKGMKAVKDAYTIYGETVSETIFVQKLHSAHGKKNFESYYLKCVTNAHANNEQPASSPAPQNSNRTNQYKNASGREDIVPEWFGKKEEPKVDIEDRIAMMEMEELLKCEAKYDGVLELIPNSESALRIKALIMKRKAELSA